MEIVTWHEHDAHRVPPPAAISGAVTVAVGHKSTLVSAGLAATLVRTPGCNVRLAPIFPYEFASDCTHDAQLIFGDSELLRTVRAHSAQSPRCPLRSAKFVWVTAGDEPTAHAAKTAGEIDEHLPLECPEGELFAVVRRLIGDGFGTARTIRVTPRGGLAPGMLRRIREYVSAHIAERLPSEDLARIAKFSLGHFNRAFRQSLGCSPHHYVLQQRVATAVELLRSTERALADIALDVGFADQSHFSRTFFAIARETPSACRRRHR